jgi:hypothetical protein
VKEVLPKPKESDNEITEITEPSSSVQKKSRLDDDDTVTLADDGKIWSKPLAETRETTRLEIFLLYLFNIYPILFREDEFEEYLQTLFF